MAGRYGSPQTVVVALLWVGATATTVAAASRSARRLDPRGGPFHLAHVIVLSWAWVLAAAVLLSLGHLLSGFNLLTGTVALALATSAGLGLRARRGPPARPPGAPPAPTWLAAAWVVVTAFLAARVAVGGLTTFVTDFDSLMYHTPMIDYWLQAGSLYAPDGSHWSNPGNSELLGFWATACFPGDFLATLNNIPAVALLAVGALELGAAVGLGRTSRHVTTWAVLANFVVLNQLVDTENDVAVAGALLTCLAYGYRFARDGRATDLALGGVSLGLLAGIKYYALGYAALAWGVAVSLAAWRRGASAGYRVAVAWGVGALLVGGYWYARNAVVVGTPFYPLGVSADSDRLHQIYPRPWRSSLLGNGRPEVPGLALRAVWTMSGPCQLAAVLAVPLVVVWQTAKGLRSWRSGRTAGDGPGRLALAVSIVGAGLVLGITPFALEDVPGTLNHLRWAYTPVRYGLGFLSLAVVGLALTLQDGADAARSALGRWPGLAPVPSVLIAALLGGSAVWQVLGVNEWHKIDWPSEAFLCTDALLVAYLARSLRPVRPKIRRVVVGACAGALAVGVALGVGWRERDWNARFVRFYDAHHATRVYHELESMGPVRLAVLDYRIHPFFGANRQFRPCQPNDVASPDALRRYLDGRGVTHVVIRRRDNEGTAAWDAFVRLTPWFEASPGDFSLIHQDTTFALYRRHPARSHAPPRPGRKPR